MKVLITNRVSVAFSRQILLKKREEKLMISRKEVNASGAILESSGHILRQKLNEDKQIVFIYKSFYRIL